MAVNKTVIAMLRPKRPARVLELGEECGEAAEAITGALGANPLKGSSHRWQDVEKELKELSDVIVTAVLALATSSPDPERPSPTVCPGPPGSSRPELTRSTLCTEEPAQAVRALPRHPLLCGRTRPSGAYPASPVGDEWETSGR